MVAIDDSREERLALLAHQIDLLSLEFAQEAAAFAAREGYDHDGFESAIDWMRFNCHLTSGAAANAICVGENLSRLGDSVEKLYDCQLGYAHLVVMARAANDVREAFDERDQDRRMADALVALASGGEVKASLQVTASVETLASLSGAPCADIRHALPVSSQAVEQGPATARSTGSCSTPSRW